MAELFGQPLLSAVFQTLTDKLASPNVLAFFKTPKLDDGLNDLKERLRSVSILLDDAEEKMITKRSVKDWLHDLQAAVYEAEDFLDEIDYEALKLKIGAPQNCRGQVLNCFSSPNPYNSCNNRLAMGEREQKLNEILKTLERLQGQASTLGLRERIAEQPSQTNRMPTTSLLDDSNVFGRDREKEDIMKLLLPNDANAERIGFILMAGMGGLGKTTLAQFVYNDSRVQEWFDLKVWVYVPKVFDVFNVTKNILKSVNPTTRDSMTKATYRVIRDSITRADSMTKAADRAISDAITKADSMPKAADRAIPDSMTKAVDPDSMTPDRLHCELERKLTRNKVLVVLDDVWDVDQEKWELFIKPFKLVKHGSKIIVTTRQPSIKPSIPTVTVATHAPGTLSKEDSWSLFEKYAFDGCNSGAHPELAEIGEEIVEKCGGLPLAVKTLGGMLRFERSVKKWKKVLTSNLWDLPNDPILPALRLSYQCLPSDLKLCFSYCAIFPKNYVFKREELVVLWMVEGFIVQQKGDEMEEVGEEYFNDLVSRSFFQQSSVDGSSYVMHDLMNDLATSVSNEFFFRLEGNSPETTERGRVRHLSCPDVFENLEGILEQRHMLRTLVLLSKIKTRGKKLTRNSVLTLKYIRVLDLSYLQLKVPNSIGGLRHLRYLNLSSNREIKRLPKSVCRLYNLQVLKLSGCYKLVKLPANMRRLINLRLLDTRGTGLKEMPLHMGELSKLRKLSDFYVGKKNGSRLKELGKFQKLGGELCIWNLEKVLDEGEAVEADLNGKEHLWKLGLRWKKSSGGENLLQERVLEKLEPHAGLKHFTISGYKGITFPNWAFPALEHLSILHCPNLREAPTNHHFPSLKSIQIDGCDSLEMECFPLEFFPKLESLKISYWPKLKLVSFSDGGSLALNLTRLTLMFCPNLKLVPKCMVSLVSLLLWRCPEIEDLSLSRKLQSLDIYDCSKLIARRSKWNLQMLPSFSEFKIGGCDDVERFPEKTLLPPSLTRLSISHLTNLKFLNYEGLRHLTSLRKLEIFGCPMLQSIPEEGLPSSVSRLDVAGCPLLEERCKREEGEDWPKISHIPAIFINYEEIK